MTEFAEWDSFYLIVGSAAGALIGLQFVVMTLIAGRPERPPYVVGATFATPTIVHFGIVFLVAALVRAPWKSVMSATVLLASVGLSAIGYALIVTRLMRSQDTYKPVFEDWLFHSIIPLAAYAILAISALELLYYPHEALFGVGASTLLLLFVGIHNAWDTVTYNIFTEIPGVKKQPNETTEQPEDSDSP
jgi:hypothetical protein